MINYREQNGCWNCQHVFEEEDYMTSSNHYCTQGAAVRPLCGSLKLSEFKNFDRNAWFAWASVHFVQPSGICDSWLAMVPEVQP